jgi:acyl-CoA thioesterase
MTIVPTDVESANKIALINTLDIKLKEIGDNYAIMEVLVIEKHGNYLGGAHGGLIAALIDSVSFFPKPILPSGVAYTTTNLNIHYVRPVMIGEKMIARSEIVHFGKRTATTSVKVENAEGKVVAHGTATLMKIP